MAQVFGFVEQQNRTRTEDRREQLVRFARVHHFGRAGEDCADVFGVAENYERLPVNELQREDVAKAFALANDELLRPHYPLQSLRVARLLWAGRQVKHCWSLCSHRLSFAASDRAVSKPRISADR